MPYIKQEKRDIFNDLLTELGYKILNKGELTYCLYKLCSIQLQRQKLKNYETLSTIMSSLEDAKLEWYRQRLAPYEDNKIVENGGIE